MNVVIPNHLYTFFQTELLATGYREKIASIYIYIYIFRSIKNLKQFKTHKKVQIKWRVPVYPSLNFSQ